MRMQLVRNPINNADLSVPKAMPLKDSTSDGSSSFSMGRMTFIRGQDPIAHTNKKWYGSSHDNQRRVFNRHVQLRLDFHNTVFNGQGKPTSFTTNDRTNRQVARQAVNKARSGGSRVPAKVTMTRPVL